MPANRLPFYRFDVADYLTDAAVAGMDADTEGCYARLLPRSWASPTPGVIPEGLVPELCGLHRLAEQYRLLYADDGHLDMEFPRCSPEEIGRERGAAVLEQLSAAFDTASRPGFWLQRRMMKEYAYATNVLNAQTRGGRNSRRTSTFDATLQVPSRQPAGIIEVEVDLGSGSSVRCSRKARPQKDAALTDPKPKNANQELDPAWRWAQENAMPHDRAATMKFAAWLVRTGTRDPDVVLAIVKHYVVHRPENVWAYYTPKGTARQSVVALTMGDKAIAEHERIKAEERAQFPRVVRNGN